MLIFPWNEIKDNKFYRAQKLGLPLLGVNECYNCFFVCFSFDGFPF